MAQRLPVCYTDEKEHAQQQEPTQIAIVSYLCGRLCGESVRV